MFHAVNTFEKLINNSQKKTKETVSVVLNVLKVMFIYRNLQ
jgi:hypothetical protein